MVANNDFISAELKIVQWLSLWQLSNAVGKQKRLNVRRFETENVTLAQLNYKCIMKNNFRSI